MASSGGSQAPLFWEDQETFFKDLDDPWFKNLPACPMWIYARPPGCQGGANPLCYPSEALVSYGGQVRQMVAGTLSLHLEDSGLFCLPKLLMDAWNP